MSGISYLTRQLNVDLVPGKERWEGTLGSGDPWHH